ncbi:EamA family transporter [Streptococcus vicugnae]|uniref:EamA family transporter n=1 Tax=Streptococcus vicugnae TaxID=2740579 RepID=A0A4R5G548_9STRE|nr:DMT family transporter [Streptococcus vicugnae]TDE71157.1 EamA family transporter [Streptococcus vicugnae]
MNKMFKGTIMVLIAGIFWGISGVSGQYLMAHGMNVDLLSCVRLITAGVIMTTIAALNQRETFLKAVTSLKALGGIAIFSLIGLVMNQYAYLRAIESTNAGTATVIQYMAPILVLAYVSLRKKQLPRESEILAIILAVLGTFIIATHGRLDGLAITPCGFVWGLFSALTYSFYIILPAKLIREYGSFTVIGLGMIMGGIVFPILVHPWQYTLVLNVGNWIGLFGIIIVGTVFAYSLFLKGTAIVGAVKGSLLACVEPISSVFFSLTIMHEVFYPMDFLGMIFIIGAVLLISLRDLVVVKKQLQ